mgnify:CR=1 FL=1|jgi:hypothetical protein|tara:strand:+ start:649 stop:1365 length:717 start_codon:yes stop_codon:yes gene_type:complete
MENITRIADLPSDAHARQNTNSYESSIPPTAISISASKQKLDDELPTNYRPINVHPNPYGISAQNPIMDAPTQSQDITMQQSMPNENIQLVNHQQMEELQNMEQQRLPSRDIPQHTIQYSNDEAIRANYIPKPETNTDYVKEHYDMTEQNLKDYEQKKRQQNHWDSIFNDIQTPIFIAILFFLFQLPIINTIIFKRFAFLSLYNDDGNFNMTGLMLKSSLFGTLYYFVYKFTTFISEF